MASHSIPFISSATLAAILVWAMTASAEPPANLAQPNAPTGKITSLWEQDFLTGDWGGARRTLCEHGINFTATYIGETFGIVSGGLKRGAVYDGLVTLALDADLEKLVGWSGATFHASGFYPHGDSGTIKYAGDLGVFSNIDFYDSYRLFELYLDQQFFGEKLSLRVGQLGYDSEFAASDFAALFINSCFGLPTAITGNVPQPSYAIAALGARLKVQPTEWLYAQAAIYDGNPATASSADPSPNAAATNEFNHYGTHWALRGDEGAFIAGEIGVKFNQPKPDPSWCESSAEADGKSLPGGKAAKAAAAPRGLASAYKLGFIYHTDRFSDARDKQFAALGSSLAPAQVRGVEGDYAVYLTGDQEVWREPGSDTDGLGLFARAVLAPASKNFFDASYEFGAVYSGLLQSDGRDQLGLAFEWQDISGQVAAATHDTNVADHTSYARPDYENVLELTYRFEITKWWNIQPDVQWIIHPGGSRQSDDAFIVGLRTQITF